MVVTSAGEQVEHVVRLDKTSDRFEIEAQRPQKLHVDPDYHLFRKLDKLEVEPTLSQVLADDAPAIVLDGPDAAMIDAAHSFAADFIEQPLYALIENGELPVDFQPGTGHSNVVINPGTNLAAMYANPELVVSGKTVFLQGKRYDLGKYDLVYCARNPFDDSLTDLVIYSNSPPRIEAMARRLGHYGKYSWLLFPAGQGRALRGNWQPAGSPLLAEKPGS